MALGQVSLIMATLLVISTTLINCDKSRSGSLPLKVANRRPPNPLVEKRHPIYDVATNLYTTIKELNPNIENILISPYSIRVINALIYLAARGETAKEIEEALQFPEHDELVETLSKQFSTSQHIKMSKFDVGNGLFVREGVRLNQTYTHILASKLKSHVSKLVFKNPGEAADQINNWVRNVTRNRIQNIVDSSAITPATSIFLANALYFSGQWENPFDEKSTKEDTFHLENGEKISVPMMQTEGKFSYNYIEELKSSGLSMPFKDTRFEFIVLKPNDNMKLEQVETLLSQNYRLDKLSRQIKQESRNVFLKMPKFRLDVHYDLVDVMRKTGIESLFDPSRADLSGLTKSGGQNFVSSMMHQTALDINENGATAAALSGVSIYPISSPSQFRLDRPFMFILNDRLTGPVFIGRITNPQKKTIVTL